MNWGECGRKQSCLNRNIISALGWRYWRKPRINSARITSFTTDIRSEHLPRTSVERYSCANLLRQKQLHAAEFLWEADTCSIRQDFPSIIWNTKVHYRVHIGQQLIPISSHMNQIHTLAFVLFKIHFNVITLSAFRRGLYVGFPTNILYKFMFSSHARYVPYPRSSFFVWSS
jgi:hypothetical protein